MTTNYFELAGELYRALRDVLDPDVRDHRNTEEAHDLLKRAKTILDPGPPGPLTVKIATGIDTSFPSTMIVNLPPGVRLIRYEYDVEDLDEESVELDAEGTEVCVLRYGDWPSQPTEYTGDKWPGFKENGDE